MSFLCVILLGGAVGTGSGFGDNLSGFFLSQAVLLSMDGGQRRAKRCLYQEDVMSSQQMDVIDHVLG